MWLRRHYKSIRQFGPPRLKTKKSLIWTWVGLTMINFRMLAKKSLPTFLSKQKYENWIWNCIFWVSIFSSPGIFTEDAAFFLGRWVLAKIDGKLENHFIWLIKWHLWLKTKFLNPSSHRKKLTHLMHFSIGDSQTKEISNIFHIKIFHRS